MATARPSDPEILLALPAKLKAPLAQVRGPKPLVLLLHPPKTGGTTLHFNLEASQSAKDLPYTRLRVDRKWTPPTLIVRNWTGAWDSPSINEDVLKPLMKAPLDQTIFISGHFPYGIEKLLMKYFPKRPIMYVGQVRNPIERELSALNYEAAKSKDGVSVEDYLRMIDPHDPAAPRLMDNPQTRLFAGIEAMTARRCDQTTFQMALTNIAHRFNLIATTEQTHPLMEAIVAVHGLLPVAYHKSNVTTHKRLFDFSPTHKSYLRDLHSFDIKLHQAVKRVWEGWSLRNVRNDWQIANEAVSDATPVVYVPQSYDADRTAYMVDVRTIRSLQSGERSIGFERPLTQKKPDVRPVHA